MRRTRPRAALGFAAVAAVVAACGGGPSAKVGPAERECTAVTQAADAIQIIDGTKATASDVERSTAAATALTDAAASATTAIAGPAGQLAAAARSYVDALTQHNVEGINVAGGLLRQRAQPVADICKTQVLGVAPGGPAN